MGVRGPIFWVQGMQEAGPVNESKGSGGMSPFYRWEPLSLREVVTCPKSLESWSVGPQSLCLSHNASLPSNKLLASMLLYISVLCCQVCVQTSFVTLYRLLEFCEHLLPPFEYENMLLVSCGFFGKHEN